MLRHSLAVAAIDARILRKDPAPVFVMTIIPLVFVPFLMPGAQAQLAALGHGGATGAEYAVPGLAVLFALLCVQQVIMAFFRERQWGTWERLRLSPATLPALLAGKSLTSFATQLVQLVIVLGGGALLFGYRPNGSLVGIAAVAVVFSVAMVAFGVLLVALFRTENQALVACNIVAMLMAGTGGAFGPVAALPDWVQAIAPASPAYWALRAMSSLSLDGASLVSVLPVIGVLAVFAGGFAVLAALAFRPRSRATRGPRPTRASRLSNPERTTA